MITIINYGLGNINAIKRVYNNLNIPVKIASNAIELENSEKYILPGVGAFDYAMDKLHKSGMRDSLDDLVKRQKKKILGICVGMQMLTKSSEEGNLPGLQWVDAEVKKFKQGMNNYELSVPHMGWNKITQKKNNNLLSRLNNNSYFYFLHSYYFEANDETNIVSTTRYGNDFVSIIN